MTVVPTFKSLAESREFFAENPHLNPANPQEKSTHANGGYVKSEKTRRIAPPVPVVPYRITDVFLQEQFDSEGDIVWALWGRGLSLVTYSIREVEHELSTVLTEREQHEAAVRRSSLRSLIVFLDSGASIPDDLEARPALQVVTQQAVETAVDEQPEQLTVDDVDGGWTPAPDHPWRKPKRQEVAA